MVGFKNIYPRVPTLLLPQTEGRSSVCPFRGRVNKRTDGRTITRTSTGPSRRTLGTPRRPCRSLLLYSTKQTHTITQTHPRTQAHTHAQTSHPQPEYTHTHGLTFI